MTTPTNTLATTLSRLHRLRARLIFDLSLVDEMSGEIEDVLCSAKGCDRPPVGSPDSSDPDAWAVVYRGTVVAKVDNNSIEDD